MSAGFYRSIAAKSRLAQRAAVLVLAMITSGAVVTGQSPVQPAEMAGYLLVPQEKVPETYDAGFSMYVAAWPLLRNYPGNRFQTGLFGTWMFAQNGTPRPQGMYSDIEGGLGWWRDTRFATTTPKFIMGGVALNFSEWANGPGAGKGRDWNHPTGLYGVAQLSPWVLWPPDGLNLKQGTCGELVGYGYLPLPLTAERSKTAGTDVPTGDQSWTLFLNTKNFKGPVAFFNPYFFSKPTVKEPKFAGMFLDRRPSDPNRALQMETQYVPAYQSVDAQGEIYARVAPVFFPRNQAGESVVVHRVTAYSRAALWDDVKAWFEGGAPASGTIDSAASVLHHFQNRGGSTWRIYLRNTPKEEKVALAWNSFATPAALDDITFGYRWNQATVAHDDQGTGPLVTLPQYYRLQKQERRSEWVVVSEDEVPEETQLRQVAFDTPRSAPAEPYVTPDEPESVWKRPGPVAGPFTVEIGDGSRVTYSWYRFADQPAILNADLDSAQREELQRRVEQLHRAWTKDQEYLPPPSTGSLAELDPALLVTPPAGFEVGYVPIVTRQGH